MMLFSVNDFTFAYSTDFFCNGNIDDSRVLMEEPFCFRGVFLCSFSNLTNIKKLYVVHMLEHDVNRFLKETKNMKNRITEIRTPNNKLIGFVDEGDFIIKKGEKVIDRMPLEELIKILAKAA